MIYLDSPKDQGINRGNTVSEEQENKPHPFYLMHVTKQRCFVRANGRKMNTFYHFSLNVKV